MHIARVTHVFFPDVIGDPFNSYALSIRQVSKGHKVSVITWAKKGIEKREKETDGFEIYRLKGINFKVNGKITEYPYIPKLPSILRKIKPDIIHAHSHLFLTTLSAIREAKKLNIPSVVSVHGVYAKRDIFINSLQKSYLYTIGRWIFKNATKIICETKSDAYEIMKYGANKKKIRIVPNAVDLDLFKPSKVKSNEPLFVWVGRFVPEKGLLYLIKAIELVVSKYKDAKFVLVGDGPVLLSIRKMVNKSRLNRNVKFTGFLDSKSISNILSKATAFVFPSLKEGMPKAVLEAMASGLPIIASNIPGVNEVVKDKYNGLLVPPRNHHALAETIINIINDKGLVVKLGINARKTVETNHSWDLIINMLESIYEEVKY